jgi:hypothetical protein
MRQLWHKIVGLLSWALFAGLWVLLAVEGKATLPSLLDSATLVAIVAGAVLAITLTWVRHNVGIYRRKGLRTGRVGTRPETSVDRLGRTLRWDVPGGVLGALDAGHLAVELEGDVKRYVRAS